MITVPKTRMLSIIFFLLMGIPLYGQGITSKKFPLNIDLVQTATLPRSGAPFELEWKLSWLGDDILEGVFEIEIFDSNKNRSLFRYDMALTDDIRHFKTFHNSMIADDVYQQLSIYTKFIVENKVHDLGEYPFRVGSPEVRYFLVGYCSDWDGTLDTPRQRLMKNNLRFENFNPYVEKKTCFTAISNVEPKSISINPVQLCRYDILVLDSYGMSYIRQGQWESILKWVSAGGSLWISVARDKNSRQLDLLNQLLSGEQESLLFSKNKKGRLLSSSKKNNWKIERDLGRIWVDYFEKNEDISKWSDKDWRKRMIYLWKFRSSHSESILSTGKWIDVDVEKTARKLFEAWAKNTDARNRNYYQSSNWYGFEREAKKKSPSYNLMMKSSRNVNVAVKTLMPASLTLPPLYLLLFLAVIYFLIVGPGDYFILGLIKKRWITWISFPLVTILMTITLVQVAHSYMNTERERNELVIHDIGSSGQIIRTSQIQLLLASSFKTVTTKVKEGLFSSLKGASLGEREKNRNLRGAVMIDENEPHLINSSAELEFQGFFPSDYQVSQDVSQWTPELLSMTSIPVNQDGPEFDWDSVSNLFINNKIKELMDKVQTYFGEDSGILLVHGEKVINRRTAEFIDVNKLVESFSIHHEEVVGLGELVSRISPSGAVNWEDIAVIDQQNSDEFWLIVIVPVETGTMVYRKRYSIDQQLKIKK